jgi:predicted TIM-barrel fold metal-dependent hydrolase
MKNDSLTRSQCSRRALLAGLAGLGAARPQGLLIDSHVHLFDPAKFPYHPRATYQPPAATLEAYAGFIASSRIDHTVIVHPEPYQDDHRYLEYCFAHEPRPGFFKGTCLFDPVAAETPTRMEALVAKLPGRIVALRIHQMRKAGDPPTGPGQPIRDRDMRAPQMRVTWKKASDLGLAIQMHFIPVHAPEIGRLAGEFRSTPVILDHLARAGQGAPAGFDEVLKLAKLPRVIMKFSGVPYSSKQPAPHADAKPLVRRAFDAFGADRMIWGGLGMNAEQFSKQVDLFEFMFDFASEPDKAKIRGLNASRLFHF